MSDDLPNLGLLIKLMKMTTSSNDGEVLVAIRKANEQLAKFGGDWEALLSGKVTVIGDPFAGLDIPAQRTTQATPPPTPKRPRPRTPTPRTYVWNPQAASPPPPPPSATTTFAGPQPKAMPTYRFGKGSNGEWLVATPDNLRVGTIVAVSKRNGSIAPVEILALVEVNQYQDNLYAFRDASGINVNSLL